MWRKGCVCCVYDAEEGTDGVLHEDDGSGLFGEAVFGAGQDAEDEDRWEGDPKSPRGAGFQVQLLRGTWVPIDQFDHAYYRAEQTKLAHIMVLGGGGERLIAALPPNSAQNKTNLATASWRGGQRLIPALRRRRLAQKREISGQKPWAGKGLPLAVYNDWPTCVTDVE